MIKELGSQYFPHKKGNMFNQSYVSNNGNSMYLIMKNSLQVFSDVLPEVISLSLFLNENSLLF